MSASSNMALIVLAAGASQRFGQADKLMADMGGQSLLAQSLAVYHALPLTRKIAVLSPNSRAQDICRGADFDIVINDKADQGMGTSLAAGITALQDHETIEHAMIGLGDMPFVKPETVHMLTRAIDDAHSIIVPQYDGQSGHPVIFAATHFTNLQKLDGDKGARGLITACPNALHFAVHDAGILRDIDTQDALIRAQST